MTTDELTMAVKHACVALLPERPGPEHWLAMRHALAHLDSAIAAALDAWPRASVSPEHLHLIRKSEEMLDLVRADTYARARVSVELKKKEHGFN